MFWRFGFHQASPLEAILEKESFTLQELLEEEDVLQECKALNRKLVEFLSQPAVVGDLLRYATAETTEVDPKIKFKYPFVSCEILSSDLNSVYDAIFQSPDLQIQLFAVLDADAALNPLLAGYFSKIVAGLLNRKTAEILHVIHQRNILARILHHIGTYSVMELLLRLLHESEELRTGGTEVSWMCSSDLVEQLISRLSDAFDSEVHANASQVLVAIVNMSGSHANPLTAVVRSHEMVTSLISFILNGPGSSHFHGMAVLVELLKLDKAREADFKPVVADVTDKLEHFLSLLRSPPRSILGDAVRLSSGDLSPPLGSVRLKTIELFCELVALDLAPVLEKMEELGIFSVCLDLFFEYENNNFLHNLVTKMFFGIFGFPQGEALRFKILSSTSLLERIVQAQRDNSIAIAASHARRKGYMGHVTQLANELSNIAKIDTELSKVVEASANWKAFAQDYLDPQNVVERRPLGGQKPAGAVEDSDDDPDDVYIPSANSETYISEDLEYIADEDAEHRLDWNSSADNWSSPVGDDDDDGSTEKWNSGLQDLGNADGGAKAWHEMSMAQFQPEWQTNFEPTFPPAHGQEDPSSRGEVEEDATAAWATFDEEDGESQWQAKDVNKLSQEMSAFSLRDEQATDAGGTNVAGSLAAGDPQPEPHPDYNHVNFWKVPLTLGPSE